MSWQVTVFLSIVVICATAVTLRVFDTEIGTITLEKADEE
jgi:hypothetical protein